MHLALAGAAAAPRHRRCARRRAPGSSSPSLASAALRRTSSLRSLVAMAVAKTGSGGAMRGHRRRRRAPCRRRCRRSGCPPAGRRRATSPSPASVSRTLAEPTSRCRPPMRVSPPREPSTMSPSGRRRAARGPAESLPPWAVWIVFITCASGGPSAGTPSRSRVAATAGASWRSAFSSRVMPLPRSAEPNSTGTACPSRNSLRRSSKTWSRGGSISSISSSISASS